MKLTLTQKEMALLFEVAQISYEGCGQWLTALVNDNYSWFRGSEVMDRLNWSKEKVGGVMASLIDKDVVGTDDTMVGVGKMSHLNIDASHEQDQNGEWVVIEGNDLYDVFKEWEKDYPEYCDNPFKEEASKPKPIRLSGNFVEIPTDEDETLDESNEETKHTSGKWEIGKINTHDGLAYHFEVFVNNGIGGKHIISESVLDEDDASLIAAAPEMLQLLKDILGEVRPEISRVNELHDQTIFNPVATETIDMAKDLIARAEGK